MDLIDQKKHKTFYSKEEIPDDTLFFSLQLTEKGTQHPDSNYLLKFKGQFYNFFQLENPVLLNPNDSFFLNERLNNLPKLSVKPLPSGGGYKESERLDYKR